MELSISICNYFCMGTTLLLFIVETKKKKNYQSLWPCYLRRLLWPIVMQSRFPYFECNFVDLRFCLLQMCQSQWVHHNWHDELSNIMEPNSQTHIHIKDSVDEMKQTISLLKCKFVRHDRTRRQQTTTMIAIVSSLHQSPFVIGLVESRPDTVNNTGSFAGHDGLLIHKAQKQKKKKNFEAAERKV